MNHGRLILKEAALSAAINGVLSLIFFLALLGLARPVPLAALAGDGLPQTFMVTLMGALIPGLIAGNRLEQSRGPIILRAVGFAFLALVVLGGGGWLIFHGQTGIAPAWPVLVLKVLYGALLGAIITAIAVQLVLKKGQSR